MSENENVIISIASKHCHGERVNQWMNIVQWPCAVCCIRVTLYLSHYSLSSVVFLPRPYVIYAGRVYDCVCGTWLHDLPYRAKTNQTYAQNTTTTTATTANGKHNGERVKTWSFQHWNIYSYYIYKASNSWCGHVNCIFALSLTERKHTHGRAPHPHTCSLQLHAQHNTHTERDSPNWEKNIQATHIVLHTYSWIHEETREQFECSSERSSVPRWKPSLRERDPQWARKKQLSHTQTRRMCVEIWARDYCQLCHIIHRRIDKIERRPNCRLVGAQ